MLEQLGIEVHLVKNVKVQRELEKASAVQDEWRTLRNYEIRSVLDVGANEGQFAAMIRRLCPEAQVFSFEPLPDVFQALQRQFAGDARVTPVNCGLSDHAGSATINRSSFTPSSSLLPMADLHRAEWPASAEQTSVSVRLERLDDWATSSGLTLAGDLLVKLDVQGHEDAVIRGGEATLRRARLAVIEVSFRELYQGQPLFDAIYRRMTDLGYVFRGCIEQHYSRRTDQILFADAIFENLQVEPGRALR